MNSIISITTGIVLILGSCNGLESDKKYEEEEQLQINIGDQSGLPNKIKLENGNPPNQIQLPKEFDFSNFIDSAYWNAPNHMNKKFYPIGWSEKGSFAYFEETPPMFAGTVFLFVIKDMKTGKNISEKKWEGEADDLNDLWENKKMEIEKTLAEFVIHKQTTEWSLIEFPVEFNNTIFKLQLKEDRDENGLLKKQTLSINSSQAGNKKLYEEELFGEFGMVKSKIIGYFKNPYENRIAILKINEIKSMENTYFFCVELIGCHLEEGFKPK